MTRHPHMPPPPHRRILWLSSSSLLLVVWLAVSQAQVRTTLTSDGTLGTTVTQKGNLYTITGGTRPGNGPNLFHSFDRFNVGTGDTASFTGPSGIANIVSRVTGGQRSDIDGILRSEIARANLFLLNPSGVLFGPKACLDVSGSFHVSTADALRLADGATFSAHLGEKSTLTVAAPAAFGFLGSTPGPITMQGSALEVPAGQTLSVVGGDLTLMGNGATSSANSRPALKAPGGRIQLVSVASPGEVGVERIASAPDLRMDGFTRLGRIDLAQGAVATVGSDGSRNAGEIEVRGGQLTLSGGSQLDASIQGAGRGGTVTVRATEAITLMGTGSRLTSSTSGDGDAGRVAVTAPLVNLQEGADIQARANGASSRGNAGDVLLEVGTLTLSGGANISASTQGAGRGGCITVEATKELTLTGANSRITSNSDDTSTGDAGQIMVTAPVLRATGDFAGIRTFAFKEGGPGKGGDIRVEVGTLMLSGGATIGSSTFGAGQGGSVTVQATEAIIRETITRANGQRQISGLESTTLGSGKGGDIRVEVGRLTLTEGARIDSSSAGAGDAGQIVVKASQVSVQKGAFIRAASSSWGNAGTILLDVGTLALTGGDPDSSKAPHISTETSGTGQGGSITVRATQEVTLEGQNSRIVSNTLGDGDAGQIMVTAPVLRATGDFAGIRTFAFKEGGPGKGGDIRVEVGTLMLSGGATIGSSTFGAGQGGSVTVQATEAIIRETITRANGQRQISGLESTTLGSGKGGDIRVEVGRLTLTEGARIDSSSAGAGPGGQVMINAMQVQLTEGARIAARSTGTGDAGNVMVTASKSLLLQNSFMTTEASQADGGNIHLTTPQMIRLRDSQITASVGGGSATMGGNITIDPQFVVLQNSQIVATAFQGRGGKIDIQAQQAFLADPASLVSAAAASKLGINGQVDIRAPVTSISGVVVPLPQAFAQAASLLRSPCAARLHEGTVSTLVERGRAGVPATPDGILPSRLPLIPLDTATPPHDGGRPRAARAWPLGESQRDPSAPLALRGWSASVDALRFVPGDCASR
jgi:filamentous hemagglutinin family protein